MNSGRQVQQSPARNVEQHAAGEVEQSPAGQAEQSSASQAQQRSGSRGQQVSLVAVMFLGSVGMWLGAPVLWLWLAGRNSAVSQTAMGSLLLILVGIPITMIAIGKVLARIDARYTAKYGRGQAINDRATWLHGVRGDGQEPTMLDKIMVISVAFALLVVGIWYVFFSAGSAAVNSAG